jgi:hypothetical protein
MTTPRTEVRSTTTGVYGPEPADGNRLPLASTSADSAPGRTPGDSAGPAASSRTRSVTLSLPTALATIVVSVLTYVAAHFWLKPLVVDIAGRAGMGRLAGGAADIDKGIGLRAMQSGTSALEIIWNGRSPLIQAAPSGRLFIVNGPAKRELDLGPDQLKSGRVFYIPVVPDVTFRLEVTDSASHSTAESVRVLNGMADPLH